MYYNSLAHFQCFFLSIVPYCRHWVMHINTHNRSFIMQNQQWIYIILFEPDATKCSGAEKHSSQKISLFLQKMTARGHVLAPSSVPRVSVLLGHHLAWNTTPRDDPQPATHTTTELWTGVYDHCTTWSTGLDHMKTVKNIIAPKRT